jgi:glycosyltransferase involved in cell wall biosynthesis
VKICVVGHSASGFGDRQTGGSERQSALLAIQLAARGHDVTYVVTGLAGDDRDVRGVRLRGAWDPEAGLRFVRAATHRYPRLLDMLREERADAYYSRGAGFHTPFVVRAARDVGARSVLALASDKDLYPASGRVLFEVPNARLSAAIGPVAHAWFRRWGLHAADWVAVQNEEQAAACATLGLRYAILPNIVEPPPEELLTAAATRDAFWAGNVRDGRRSKGLNELADLAAILPDVSFSVAGTIRGESSRPALEALERLPSVELDGPLSHAETQRRMAHHRLIVNTSPSEGFSNVMLEGWALGRPSVTLAVNPSGLLSGDRLGICGGGDVTTMAAAVVALLEEPAALSAMGRRCRDYVAGAHAAETVCGAFERLVG